MPLFLSWTFDTTEQASWTSDQANGREQRDTKADMFPMWMMGKKDEEDKASPLQDQDDSNK